MMQNPGRNGKCREVPWYCNSYWRLPVIVGSLLFLAALAGSLWSFLSPYGFYCQRQTWSLSPWCMWECRGTFYYETGGAILTFEPDENDLSQMVREDCDIHQHAFDRTLLRVVVIKST